MRCTDDRFQYASAWSRAEPAELAKVVNLSFQEFIPFFVQQNESTCQRLVNQLDSKLDGLMEQTDSELLSACADGDRTAFDRFVLRHVPAVLRFCLSRALDRHVAEDVTQEAMIRLYKQVCSKQLPEEPLPWLFAIARRCCQEVDRRKKREFAAQIHESISAREQEQQDDFPALAQAMDSLSDVEVAILHLKHTEGLRCLEIGRRLGKPVGTVTAILSRAYAKLRDKLRGEGS